MKRLYDWCVFGRWWIRNVGRPGLDGEAVLRAGGLEHRYMVDPGALWTIMGGGRLRAMYDLVLEREGHDCAWHFARMLLELPRLSPVAVVHGVRLLEGNGWLYDAKVTERLRERWKRSEFDVAVAIVFGFVDETEAIRDEFVGSFGGVT